MLSHTAQYALRAVAYLAEREGEAPIRVSEIAEALEVPRTYLSKVLHQLTGHGIVSSTRGRRGGFRLAVPPRDLSLARVIGPFDEFGGPVQCLLKDRRCSESAPCSAHDEWQKVAQEAHGFFRRTTVAELVGRSATSASTGSATHGRPPSRRELS